VDKTVVGRHSLKPSEVNELVALPRDEVVLLRVIEARIGKFKNAVVPT